MVNNKAGHSISKITVKDANGNEVLCNDAFMFEMPQSNVTLEVSFAVAGYTVTRVFDGNGVGNSTALIKVGESFIEDGGSIAYGSKVVIVPQVDGNVGSQCTKVQYKASSANDSTYKDATPGTDGTWSFNMIGEPVTVKVTFTKTPFKLNHAHATGSPASSYTLVVEGNSPVTGPGTTDISVGQKVTIKPEAGYQVNAVSIKYTNANDQIVNMTIHNCVIDEEGFLYFTIPTAPKAGTGVDLTLSFALKTEQNAVIDGTTYDTDKVTATFNGGASGIKLNSGSTVTVELKVRYNQKLDKGSIEYKYYDGTKDIVTAIDKDNVKFKAYSDKGADAIYTFTFVMPKYETELTYKLEDQTTYNFSCATALNPGYGTVGSDVVVDTGDTTVTKADISYMVGGEPRNSSVEVTDGKFTLKLSELPWHGNNKDNNVNVTLVK